MDTASACSLVRGGLVKPQWILPGEWLSLKRIHGDRKSCLVAQVPLEMWGRFDWKWIGVVEGLSYPVVLGMDWDLFPGGKVNQRWKKGMGRASADEEP